MERIMLMVALLIPFIRAGEWLFGVKSLNLSSELIQRMMKEDLWKTIIDFWSATMRAVMVWLLIAPIIVALVYLVMTPLLKKPDRTDSLLQPEDDYAHEGKI